MPVLGKALANYLRNIRGLYSVELPSRLRNEILDFVLVCNEKEANQNYYGGERMITVFSYGSAVIENRTLRFKVLSNNLFQASSQGYPKGNVVFICSRG